MNKILVVDDNLAIRMLYTEELIEEGYDVISHDGRKELMDVIKREIPDLMVLDIKLGEDSGLDMLRDIRNAYGNLPVILCSAYPDFNYDLKTIGADYYVLKSSDMSDLKLKVRLALEGLETFNPPPEGEKEPLLNRSDG
jgi:DNA-binding response OmpR family regulator